MSILYQLCIGNAEPYPPRRRGPMTVEHKPPDSAAVLNWNFVYSPVNCMYVSLLLMMDCACHTNTSVKSGVFRKRVSERESEPEENCSLCVVFIKIFLGILFVVTLTSWSAPLRRVYKITRSRARDSGHFPVLGI